MKNRIGIMEGRLSCPMHNEIQAFPINSWREEFEKANTIGFEVIEWIFDLYEKNPIMDNEGINEIKNYSKKNNITINSVCADFFMKKTLFGVSSFELNKNLLVLKKLMERCNKLEIEILELPFVDSSSLKNSEDKKQILRNLEQILPYAQENNIKITLETDLPPNSFKDILSQFNHPNIMANYDVGNSVALGYDPEIELKILSDWIVNIHVKDRILHGNTVPLGTGDVDFEKFFYNIKKIGYRFDLIIQGAREDLSESKIKPEMTCAKYLKFVKQYLDKYNS